MRSTPFVVGFDMDFARAPKIRSDAPEFYPSFMENYEEGMRIIWGLVAEGYIEVLPRGIRPAVVNPWGLVPKSDGKVRPILDFTRRLAAQWRQRGVGGARTGTTVNGGCHQHDRARVAHVEA